VGPPDPDSLNGILGRAVALLSPIGEKAPFSFSILEANACGTPAVAFNRGAIREFVEPGVNGLLVSNVESAASAVAGVKDLCRRSCRAVVEERFSARRMVDDYMGLYNRVLEETAGEDQRPWGYYKILSDRPDHKVKRIVVFPGKRLSLQRHRHRSEQWTIISGTALVTRDYRDMTFEAGESIDIPVGTVHRVFNPGNEPVVFIEVQTGDYFGEDDIERIEDDFGRIGR
jgi:mannose-6-phosphate isomerase-like protein (cupin superfamily)